MIGPNSHLTDAEFLRKIAYEQGDHLAFMRLAQILDTYLFLRSTVAHLRDRVDALEDRLSNIA